MPANERSLRITDAYRDRLARIALRAEPRWHLDPEDLDRSFAPWLSVTTRAVAYAQRQAVQLTAGYLGAYMASELGHRVATPQLDTRPYVGVARNGSPLPDVLSGSLIAVKSALKNSKPIETALEEGLNRARRNVSLSVWTSARSSLADLMKADERIIGWRRAVRGTCDACLGLASDTTLPPGTPLDIHPGCECIAEPSLFNAPERHPRPTGHEIFSSMAPAEQDNQFGPEKAKLLREGTITLAELVGHSQMETEPDFITARPVSELVPQQ